MFSPKLTSGSGHEGWFLPESLNGGCRSSKETSAKTRRAASETPIPAADDIALVTTPPGERPLELNDRTPCYGAAADSGADASRSQRRADRVLRQQVASVDQPLRRGLTSSR